MLWRFAVDFVCIDWIGKVFLYHGQWRMMLCIEPDPSGNTRFASWISGQPSSDMPTSKRSLYFSQNRLACSEKSVPLVEMEKWSLPRQILALGVSVVITLASV